MIDLAKARCAIVNTPCSKGCCVECPDISAGFTVEGHVERVLVWWITWKTSLQVSRSAAVEADQNNNNNKNLGIRQLCVQFKEKVCFRR